MTSIDYVDIKLPKEAADDYYKLASRDEIENFMLLDNEWYQKLLEPDKYFILGPKGCGKTLYAAYMCAKKRANIISKQYTLQVEDYGKLIQMKLDHHLQYTDYSTMWKVILLQKFLFGIGKKELSWWKRRTQFSIIQSIMRKHFGNSVTDDTFNPTTYIDQTGKQQEITDDIRMEGSFKATAGVSVKGEKSELSGSAEGGLGGNRGRTTRVLQTGSQSEEHTANVYTDTWTQSIDAFTNLIGELSFRNDHCLFIDGLDARLGNIDAQEYSDCIKALLRAVDDINRTIFGSTERKDHKVFKIVALTRTDIFIKAGLINGTSKIRDNSVELDWTIANEHEFSNSKLFKMINRILGGKEGEEEKTFRQYFNFLVRNRYGHGIDVSTFIQRKSRLRPRDIVAMLHIIKDVCSNKNIKNPTAEVIDSAEFRSKYEQYYADQIRSELSFWYPEDEVEKMFDILASFLTKWTFTEAEFKTYFEAHKDGFDGNSKVFKDYRAFLDALYSVDVIGWREKSGKKKTRVHWHYREVKAATENLKLPWGRISKAVGVEFLVQEGVGKDTVGIA